MVNVTYCPLNWSREAGKAVLIEFLLIISLLCHSHDQVGFFVFEKIKDNERGYNNNETSFLIWQRYFDLSRF